jgi:hypothetical protein
MAEQMRPASRKEAPDPSNAYERSHPDREAGMGRLDNNTNATPEDRPDCIDNAVTNRQPGDRQLNGGEPINQRGLPTDEAPPAHRQPDHSMHDEEPDGWDQAPTDIRDPRQKRHPRTGGKGGTPDAGDARRDG